MANPEVDTPTFNGPKVREASLAGMGWSGAVADERVTGPASPGARPAANGIGPQPKRMSPWVMGLLMIGVGITFLLGLLPGVGVPERFIFAAFALGLGGWLAWRRDHLPVRLTGEVRGLQERGVDDSGKKRIWSFRIERFDAAGNRLPEVEVALHGRELRGSLREGDRVAVRAPDREGHAARISTLMNLTTGERVTVGGGPWFATLANGLGWGLWGIVMLFVVALLAVLLKSLITG